MKCQVKKNKYYKWYMNIINNRMTHTPSGYTESHHITPKCVDPNSDEEVKLTPREHFIAHLLLPKFIIANGEVMRKLKYASWAMCKQRASAQSHYTVTSRVYAITKTKYIKTISGDNHWMKDEKRRKHLSKVCKGRIFSDKTRQKLSDAMSGRKLTCDHKEKIGAANSEKKRTEEMNKAQSKMMKERAKSGIWVSPTQGQKRDKHKCQYCGKMVDIANLNRWHGEKCKQKPTTDQD